MSGWEDIGVAAVTALITIVFKQQHDIGKLKGEAGAMARVLGTDRREAHRAVVPPSKAKQRIFTDDPLGPRGGRCGRKEQ